jgi:transposase
VKDSYSETGRPSIDPELLLRILLIGYLYGIMSERKLMEELRMHLAWRWFTGLSFDQEIPHHSTFSKNRHIGSLPPAARRRLVDRPPTGAERLDAAALATGYRNGSDQSFCESS